MVSFTIGEWLSEEAQEPIYLFCGDGANPAMKPSSFSADGALDGRLPVPHVVLRNSHVPCRCFSNFHVGF